MDSAREVQEEKCGGKRQTQMLPLTVGMLDVEEDKHEGSSKIIFWCQERQQAECQTSPNWTEGGG